jgi:hypothetical protein
MKTFLLCCLLSLPALTGAAASADRDQRCAQLLPAMQTALQALRRGQSLTLDQQTTWRTWNADCKAAKWQQQLAETAPPPPPLEKNFPKMLPPPERQEAPEAPSTEVLPSGFVGADPQSTVEWFKKSLSQIPIKIDQYSTATERAQFDQLLAQQFNSLEPLPFILPESSPQCQKKYNPDAQWFSFRLYTSIYPPSSEIYKRYQYNRSKLPIFEERKSLGSYEASNAFGVRATVTQGKIEEITLAFPMPYPGKDEFSVQMAPSEARESDKDMRCLVMFRPSPPYVLDYSDYTTPTLDTPWSFSIKGTALFGRLEQLWIFNQRSGKIYTKVK